MRDRTAAGDRGGWRQRGGGRGGGGEVDRVEGRDAATSSRRGGGPGSSSHSKAALHELTGFILYVLCRKSYIVGNISLKKLQS